MFTDLRAAGAAGWAGTAMVFTGVIIISGTGAPEPNVGAPADDVLRYLQTQAAWAVAVGGFLLAFGLVAWLWFVCGLAAAVRRPGTDPDLLPTVVLVSGTAAVAVMLNGAPQASEYRGAGLDPHAALFAFDLAGVTLANMCVALASVGLAAGRAMLGHPAWPAWLGWWALTAGAGCLLTRMIFPSPLWYLPYLLFWVWVLVVSTRLLRARPKESP